MKRAFLKKVKPVSCSQYFPNSGSLDIEVGESEQTQFGARRRLRTSAAMVGLALSMGATGLLVPRHGDGASAAESNETAASTSQVATLSPDLHELITAPPPSAQSRQDAGTLTEYVVGQGQTLQQIAQRYQISVEALAAVNRISPTDLLKPGQVLRLPGNVSAGLMQSPQMQALAELSRLPAPDLTSQVQARDQALGRLMQEQAKLKDQLVAMRRGEPATIAAAGAQQTANKQVPSPLPSPVNSLVPGSVTLPSPVGVQSAAQPAAPAFTLAATPAAPTVSPTISPAAGLAPDLDWMQANRSLTIPPAARSGAAVSPELASAETAQPTVTLPRQSTAPIRTAQVTTAMGLGMAEQSYQVGLGDTVARIARAHNVSQSAIISANRLSDPDVIFVGQRLKVPAVRSENNLAALPTVVPSSRSAQPSGTALPAIPTQVRQSQLAVVPSTLPSSIPASTLNLPSAPAAREVSGEAARETGPNVYVQNLLSEVKALRGQRSSRTEQPAVSRTEAPQSIAVASPAAASLSNSSLNSRPVVPSIRRQQEPAVVAAAPLSSESYAPLTEQIPGRMVSPDLPALPDADRFLPDGKLTGFIWPARGVLTSGYGWRWGRMHAGIDIASDVGTPIYAAATGVVQYAGWNSGGYGNMVEIKHADGSMTRYGHMNAIHVQEGQRVSQSEQIGEMGSTGYSTGPHLHFEVHPVASGGAVNPMAYLPPQ